jgi:hypothetical protein
MAKKFAGKKYPLLLYQRIISRHRSKVFYIAVLLLGVGLLSVGGYTTWPSPPADIWLFVGGVITFGAWLIAGVASRLAYAQPRHDHLRVQTPVYRLKVSYRRIRHTRPVDIAKLFPPGKIPRGDATMLRPFYGLPAVGLDLQGWPMKPSILRFFFNRYMLAPDQSGLILIVDEWMGLSNQISSAVEEFRSREQPRPPSSGTIAMEILSDGHE